MPITVPPGFTLETIAHVQSARELAVAPNGDLFVGTSSNHVYVIRNPEGQPSAPRIFVTLPDDVAAGVTFGGASLYVGTEFGVYRIAYENGDETAREKPQKIASVRTSGVSRDHVTTSVAFANGKLYASVGSSCDVCDPELDKTRATIQEMNPDGSGMHPKAVHIRNAIALAVDTATNAVWAGVAGQDELPPGHPYEIFDPFTLHAGTVDYGWPYCYDNHKSTDGRNCSSQQEPRVVFPAYLTPIGAAIYPQHQSGRHAFPSEYRGGAFVALHGSWHRPLRAPLVAFVPLRGDEPVRPLDWSDPNRQWHQFVDGFQLPSGQRTGRPTGVAVGREGDVFVADDFAMAVYRIRAGR